MANNYEKILELANKNNMGLSNTIKRDYGIPLDYSSVQESYEAALKYAQTSTLAYIGQPISVGDALYIVTDAEHGYLKPVGEGDIEGMIRYDEEQNITDEQKAKARENIGTTDGTWENMPDKPFYKEEKYAPLHWDGVIDDKPFVEKKFFEGEWNEATYRYVKIAETSYFPDFNQNNLISIKNSFMGYAVPWNASLEPLVLGSVDVGYNGVYYDSSSLEIPLVYFIVSTYGTTDDLAFPETGVYVAYNIGDLEDYVSDVYFKSNIVPLPDEFLPSNILKQTDIGVPWGLPTLDINGKISETYLPSYVDDVIEGYYNNDDSNFYKEYYSERLENKFSIQIEGEKSKIYLDLLTNSTYRWSGSQYVCINATGTTTEEVYILEAGETEEDIPDGIDLAIFPEETADDTAVKQLSDSLNHFVDYANAKFEESENILKNKAALVDGKVPLEQLPDNISSEISWEDVTNKPFEDRDALSIEWNGDATGKDRITVLEEEYEGDIFEYCFIKVHDTPITEYFDIVGSYITFGAIDELLDYEVTLDSIGMLSNGNFIIFCEGELSIINILSNESPVDLSAYEEIPPVSFPSTGVYYLAAYYNRDYTLPTGLASKLFIDNTKTLDLKYLPKNIALGYTTKKFEDIYYNTKEVAFNSRSICIDVDDGEGNILQITAYKASDMLLTKSQVLDSRVWYFYEDEGCYIDWWDLNSVDYLVDVNPNGSFVTGEGNFFVITEDNTDADLSEFVPDLYVNFPERGIWFTTVGSDGMIFQGTLGLTSLGEITPIDLKYLPINKPYGLVGLNYAGKIDREYINTADYVGQWEDRPVISRAVYAALQNVNVDMSNYYTKGDLDSKLATINGSLATIGSQSYPKSETYSKSEINTAHDDLRIFMGNTYYTKTETYNKSETYNKNEVDAALANIDLSDYYKKSEIDALLGDVDSILNEINAILGGD